MVVARERNGKALTFVFKREGQAVAAIGERVAPDATVYADDAASWDALHTRFLTKRIDHSVCYSDGEACTNQAESRSSPASAARRSARTTISPGATCGAVRERDGMARKQPPTISNGAHVSESYGSGFKRAPSVAAFGKAIGNAGTART